MPSQWKMSSPKYLFYNKQINFFHRECINAHTITKKLQRKEIAFGIAPLDHLKKTSDGWKTFKCIHIPIPSMSHGALNKQLVLVSRRGVRPFPGGGRHMLFHSSASFYRWMPQTTWPHPIPARRSKCWRSTIPDRTIRLGRAAPGWASTVVVVQPSTGATVCGYFQMMFLYFQGHHYEHNLPFRQWAPKIDR